MSVAAALQTRLLAILADGLGPDVAAYVDAPENAPFPFVRFDRAVEAPVDTQSTWVTERFLYLSVHSDVHGNDEAQDILEAIEGLLHDADLNPLAEGRAVLSRVTQSEVRADDGAVTYTGFLTLRVVTQDTNADDEGDDHPMMVFVPEPAHGHHSQYIAVISH
jgi:hypothetical protein